MKRYYSCLKTPMISLMEQKSFTNCPICHKHIIKFTFDIINCIYCGFWISASGQICLVNKTYIELFNNKVEIMSSVYLWKRIPDINVKKLSLSETLNLMERLYIKEKISK